MPDSVQWFLYFQNETHTVVLYDLRSPNPKYDPLKLRFSIWARPLKVLPFLIYILSIWISRRQWRQRRRRDKSAGSTHTFSRRVPAIVINHWFYCKLGLLWRLKRCELPPPPPGARRPGSGSSVVIKMARPAPHLPVRLRLFQTRPLGRAGTVRGVEFGKNVALQAGVGRALPFFWLYWMSEPGRLAPGWSQGQGKYKADLRNLRFIANGSLN